MNRLSTILGLLFLLLFDQVYGSDASVDVGITAGYTENLFNDSAAIADSYTSPYMSLNYYPSSSVEINVSGGYSAYRDNVDLSSFSGGGGITYVSVEKDKPLSFYLAAGMSIRRYGDLYSEYDYLQGNASATARYRLTSRIHLKCGGAFSSNDYSNSETGDNYGIGVFGGINTTIWGSNTIDVEGGLDFTGFSKIDSTKSRGWRNPVSDSTLESDLQTAYFSVRFSRSLGSHSGINVEYAARAFVGDDNVATYGLTLDNLSPWTSFWEGQAVSAEIKSYLLPNFILTGGARFQNAVYMDALESDGDEVEETFELVSREDDRLSVFAGIQRSFVVSPGVVLRPSFNISYVDNQSTHSYYEYSSLAFSFQLNLQF